MPDKPTTYRDAGVDTHAGRDFVKRIAGAVKSTHGPEVLLDRAGFGGLFDASALKDYEQPVLVSSTDGVGTKLHLAKLYDRHETVGIDLTAMCVNDLLATGARPLFFMDYIACGKLDQARMAAIVEGIAAGCRAAGCALTGGETAEHPDTMAPDDYDLGGFTTGVVERARLLDPERVQAGDVLIGVPSSGVHSNGMSLVRRLFLKDGLHLPEAARDRDFLLHEILLRPTIIYERGIRDVLDAFSGAAAEHGLRALAHVTGGGFFENLPRILPDGLLARIDRKAWTPPPVFATIQDRGKIDDREMFSVYNMGIGLVMAVAREQADAILAKVRAGFATLRAVPELAPCFTDNAVGEPMVIGEVVANDDPAQVVI